MSDVWENTAGSTSTGGGSNIGIIVAVIFIIILIIILISILVDYYVTGLIIGKRHGMECDDTEQCMTGLVCRNGKADPADDNEEEGMKCLGAEVADCPACGPEANTANCVDFCDCPEPTSDAGAGAGSSTTGSNAGSGTGST